MNAVCDTPQSAPLSLPFVRSEITYETLTTVSALLRYPDEAFADDLLAVAAAHGNDEIPSGIGVFARNAAAQRVTSLQETYLRTFEGDPKASLYLSWHRYGDDPSRGRALAALNELYADAGFELVGGELPDYVPAVLEFLAEAPDWAAAVMLDGFGKELLAVTKRVAEGDSIYAPLMAELETRLSTTSINTPLCGGVS